MKIKKINTLFDKVKKTRKFSNQLFVNFLLLAIIPVLVTSFVSYVICYKAILNNSVSLSHEITNYASQEINRLQIVTNNIAASIQNNPELQVVMRYSDKNSPYNLISNFQINTSLSLIQKSSMPEIAGIYCISNNGGQYQTNTTSVQKKDYSIFSWYKNIISSKDPIWFPPHMNSFVSLSADREFISYGVPFIDYITNLPIGIIIIDIETSTFFDILNNSTWVESNHYYVLDDMDNIIFSSNPDINLDSSLNNSESLENIKNSKYYYSQTLSNSWKIIGVISENKIAKSTLLYLYIFIIIMLIIAIPSTFIISLRRAKQISQPIDMLTRYMLEVENGNYDIKMNIPNTNDEIVTLYHSFEKMVSKSNEYMAEIKYEQKELQKANFKALQAQINPHFLYNTMDTIAWNIRLDEKDKAIAAIMALTKFFRSSLRKGEDIITLQQEMEQISLYLQIQELRYGDMLDYDIEHNPALNNYILPKLILQPIVENAIYHGIKNKEDKGHILITTIDKEDYIIISITDNGIGITPDQLTLLNEMVHDSFSSNTDSAGGYGVKNVSERIKIYFGEDYGLYYMSEYSKYTTVHIKLPKIDKELANNTLKI
ncbi:sensor histidine kinase [Clostridium grantii]|uniref:Two-component system, sensor histidine kinase YesM n=1 Tax=Clostridium grantii DSM 8605 TaxID=1121316 RepID=A0A1M5V6C9_9CLOT|nr:sensor histidine kinase [Clostridium grantii]SHH70708.1 two-component system, sensor histidine kinase YesM [Clostridium grantii DSM 8605]